MRLMVKMEKNLEFLFANLNIMLKKLVEYKTNMYFVVIEHLIFRFSFIMFYYVIFTNFSEIGLWSFEDFILFFIINDYLTIIAGVLYWRKSLFFQLTTGQFNLYLVRPVKVFLNYLVTDMSEEALMYIIINTIINIFMIWYFNIIVTNIILGISAFLLVLLFFYHLLISVIVLTLNLKGLVKHYIDFIVI